MLMSSIVIGLIILATASGVSQISSERFTVDKTPYKLNMLNDEAKKLDLTQKPQRERYERVLNSVEEYDVSSSYWENRDCLNVTLSRVGDQINMNCLN